MSATPRKPRVTSKTTRANASRGEHEITLAKVTYLLRPSFAACQGIEAALGRSLIELLRSANMAALTYEELGVALTELIRAGADDDMTKRIHPDRIAELVFEEGSGAAMARLTLVLADAISGGRDIEGNSKAQPT